MIIKSLGGGGVLGLHILHKHQDFLLYTYDLFVGRLIPPGRQDFCQDRVTRTLRLEILGIRISSGVKGICSAYDMIEVRSNLSIAAE